MGISRSRHQAHVEKWLNKFTNYKKKWPNNLFRHEPVENAIAIFKAGAIISRNDAVQGGALINDIAPTDIIQNRNDAYSSVRLYFRPRTPTQYRIEGIRKRADYYKDKHGGLLVMLVFNGEVILTMNSTRFSCGNMQSSNSTVLDGDAGFDQLDFSGTYHDEAYPSDDQKRRRCAEILANSPLNIIDTLSAIVVRTDADLVTLKYMLHREDLNHLVPLVKKSEGTNVFFQRFTALQFVDVAPGRINFKLKGTASIGKIQTKLTVFDDANNQSYDLFAGELKSSQAYFTAHNLPSGHYRIMFSLEGCFAHESNIYLLEKSA